jgi:hypothetical protein
MAPHKGSPLISYLLGQAPTHPSGVSMKQYQGDAADRGRRSAFSGSLVVEGGPGG